MDADTQADTRKRRIDDLFGYFISHARRVRRALGSVPERVPLTEPTEGVHNDGRDNVDHDYICYVGDEIRIPDTGMAYKVLGRLGSGTFGQVLKCKSTTEGRFVALKVVKRTEASPELRHEAEEEVRILRLLSRTPAVVRMLDSFVHHGHLFIALELLGPSLLRVLEEDGQPGLPVDFIRDVTQQLLEALQHLSDVPLIHGDMKPENVLLVDSHRPLVRNPQVKVIDFGGSQHCERVAEAEDFTIQTLPYRAPEVLLGLPYTCAADMWSLGCICAELFLGESIFPHSDTEHDVVRRTVDLIGPLPPHMLRAGRNTELYFRRIGPRCPLEDAAADGGHWLRFLSRLTAWVRGIFDLSAACASETNGTSELTGGRFRSGTDVGECDYQLRRQGQDGDNVPLEQAINHTNYEIVRTWASVPQRLRRDELERQRDSRRCLLDFLRRTLRINPDERWTPSRASRHNFFAAAHKSSVRRRSGARQTAAATSAMELVRSEANR
mmetsp:Transcript_105625/g.297129  ORF Transcript_105625/g.297129 Transcript_105625/m.297129 type:complete len:496 (-) Transcript_105625:37-1524(-)